MQNDTIAAIATAPGTGAIAVIRVSGPQAARVVQECTGGRVLRPRLASLVRVRDAREYVVDECVATYFAAPASFTGEDTVELSCHGGMLVTRRVLERVLACGARPAEPGEFSRRAFENGKMDLTQAEAVMDVISAGSDLALRAAQNQLQGAIGSKVEAAVDILINVAAHVEAYIDFPEEDIAPDTTETLLAQLDEVAAVLRRLLDTADEGRLLREGVRTAIVGAPNVGKSSLLNMLLGYERAIVSSTAGTTRDTIEESVVIDDIRFRFVDTAGLHDTEDKLEKMGIERTEKAIQKAQIVLYMTEPTQGETEIPALTDEQTLLLVVNKIDTSSAREFENAVYISARDGEGIDELRQALRATVDTEGLYRGEVVVSNLRHFEALSRAHRDMTQAISALDYGISEELLAEDIRSAINALAEITGRITSEDILKNVFANFCIGK